MLTLLSNLDDSMKSMPAIEHALQVRKACALNNYVKFFKLHKVRLRTCDPESLVGIHVMAP
jgi:hypothetical protein